MPPDTAFFKGLISSTDLEAASQNTKNCPLPHRRSNVYDGLISSLSKTSTKNSTHYHTRGSNASRHGIAERFQTGRSSVPPFIHSWHSFFNEVNSSTDWCPQVKTKKTIIHYHTGKAMPLNMMFFCASRHDRIHSSLPPGTIFFKGFISFTDLVSASQNKKHYQLSHNK